MRNAEPVGEKDNAQIRGRHCGHRSCEPHEKAEHAAAPIKPAT